MPVITLAPRLSLTQLTSASDAADVPFSVDPVFAFALDARVYQTDNNSPELSESF